MTKEGALKSLKEVNELKQEYLKNLREIEEKEKEIEEIIRKEDIKENVKKIEYLKKHKDIILPLIETHIDHKKGTRCNDSDYFDFQRNDSVKCPRCFVEDIFECCWDDIEITFNLNFKKI